LQNVPALYLTDPVLPFLTTRQLVLAVSVIEVLALNVLIWHKDRLLKVALISALSSCFLIYRVSLYLATGSLVEFRCPCLGFVGDWLHLPRLAEVVVSSLLMWYLFVGSYLLFCLYRRDSSLGHGYGRYS